VREVAKKGEEMSAACDASYHLNDERLIHLEFEKIYWNFLQLAKKRYAGLKFDEGNLDAPKLDYKGIELARRDCSELTKRWMRDVLELVFVKEDVEGVRAYIREHLREVYSGKLPLSVFVNSKQLSKKPSEYKSKPEHVILAERLMGNPEFRISIGDRIAYVIRAGFKGEKVRDRAVLPSEIADGTYALDTTYYVERKLQKPLTSLLKHIIPDVHTLFQEVARTAPRTSNTRNSRVFKMFAKRKRTAEEAEGVRKRNKIYATIVKGAQM
jgi:DNA polymerase elongation subunit (family B)